MNGLLKSAYMKVSRVLSPQCSFPSMTSQEEEVQRGGSTANKSGLIKDQTRRKVRRRLATWEWSELADGGEVR